MVGLAHGLISWSAPGADAMSHHVPAPVAKASGLIEQIGSIALTDEEDDLTLRRIEREARGLMDVDLVGAHTVLGAVAALRGRVADVRSHYRIALQHSGRSVDTCHNYSVSLMGLGEMNEAFKVAGEAFRRAPDNGRVLHHLISVAIGSARFREARDLCDRWNALFPESPSPYEPPVKALAGAIERGAFREESVREVLHIAHEIQSAANVILRQTAVLADGNDPDSFLYDICIPASPTRTADLNEELADRLADRPELMADPGTKFAPMFIGTRVDAGYCERTA